MSSRFYSKYGVVAMLIISIVFLGYSWYSVIQLKKRIDDMKKYQIKRDWHDYAQMMADELRQGPGENGVGYIPDIDKNLVEYQNKLEGIHGFNALISDYISVNRTVPDIRHKECQRQHYLANLPNVSIVMIFNNEHYSVLLRSIHSIVNRTPKELLKEIVLVDDASNLDDLGVKLEEYILKNFPQIYFKLIRLKERSGLIKARLAGAREAEGKILVFLDSHVEPNYNWLPPLIEPIAFNRRAVVCPLIDIIHFETFAYTSQDEGARGAFDWKMDYKRLPLRLEDYKQPTKPSESPVMAGGLFAIARDFFWHLGGYDPGLDIWGGEQYELSFKIWMCGGIMLEAPCSRVGHIYRGEGRKYASPRHYDYLSKNLKRVAEVWMDEYKIYFYNKSKEGYFDNLDPGDLTIQKDLRKKLQCKSFDWFMKEVAPDILLTYPPIWPPSYAYGAIKSLANNNLCLFAMFTKNGDSIGLTNCTSEKERLPPNQNFELSYFNDLRFYHGQYCLEPESNNINVPLQLVDCHQIERVEWAYDREKQFLRLGRGGVACLEALPSNMSVTVNMCSEHNLQMRWNISVLNHTALDAMPHPLKNSAFSPF